MDITRELFEDVAAELGINEPSLVEKDYHVVHTLVLLKAIQSTYFKLIFAGGTCLSKTFASLQRMSEDIDLKIILTAQGSGLSKSALRKALGQLRRDIEATVVAGGFAIHNVVSRNDNHFIGLELAYVAMFDVVDTLRPNIKIELTVCGAVYDYDDQPISTLATQVMNGPPEINDFPCVSVDHTAAEKLVSLLRRTAASLSGIDDWADDALVRHIYDLYIIHNEHPLNEGFVDLVHKTVQSDALQFANRHKAFLEAPEVEIKKALQVLGSDSVYRQRYNHFLGPLVYAVHKPSFEQGMETLNLLATRVWGKGITSRLLQS